MQQYAIYHHFLSLQPVYGLNFAQVQCLIVWPLSFPPTAFIMAISGLRERTFLIFPTNLLPLTNASRVADQMMLFRDVL